MERIFGFDIGTTSIGWAVIDYSPGENGESGRGRIVAKDGVPGLGVRIFPEARDPDGTPLNQQRRQKRMMRRQLRRRKERRRLLNELLSGAGLLPAFSKEKNSAWAEMMKLDPYILRVRGLTEALTPHEFGRAIYHLAHRRHFRGRDLEDADEQEIESEGEENGKRRQKSKETDATTGDADELKASTERKQTLALLKKRGITLGQYLAERNADARKGAPPTERRRNIHAHRNVVDEEFEQLWAAQVAQEPHIPALCDGIFKESIKNAVFAQRPVFWRKNTLGKCRLMPGESLCPKGSWLSQQRRMLEKLNNLAVTGGNARPLDAEERTAILAKLQTQGSMSWSGVRNALKPLYKARGDAGIEKSLKFNLELGGDTKLLGNPLEAKLADIFGENWEKHPHKQAIRDAVHSRLWDADYGEIGTQRVVIRSSAERTARRERAAASFIADFGATLDQAAKLRDLSLPTGWEPFSTAALEKILPTLEEGVRVGMLLAGPEYDGWRRENFPNREHPTGEFCDRLPSPNNKDKKTGKISHEGREELQRIATLRNPTVVRTQNELRKVVNNLIAVYGKPDRIRVELTREVGMSKREREEKQAEIRKNERRRKDAIKDLESKGIAEPSRETVEKWMLWKESQEKCPYTGDSISFDALFREVRYDVEHIWPRWRSFDNGARNKTLCRKDVNLRKGNRTPFEAFGHNEDEWAAMKTRLDGMTAKKGGAGMQPGKVKRFLAEKMPDDFASRQLNDTGYAARQAMEFLKRLWPDLGPESPVYVQAVSGRVTAQLRQYWGLNNILSDDGEKTRADHRHHAVDALTVACAHPGMTNVLSRYLQQKDDPRAERPKLPEPWPTIREDAETAVEKIVISHRVRKKISGPLHKETVYGDTREDVKSNRIIYRVVVQRVQLSELNATDIEAKDLATDKFVIRDRGAASAIRTHIATNGGDLKKSLAQPVALGTANPSLMKKIRIRSKRQISGMRPYHNGLVDPEAKHHVAIYEGEPAEPVSIFEAVRRNAKKQPVIRKRGPKGGRLLMTLCKGDCVNFEDPRAAYWIVREIKSNGQITLVPHIEARATKQAIKYQPTASGLMELQPKKYSIDPIGRVRPAND